MDRGLVCTRPSAPGWATGTPAKATIANISTRGGGMNDSPSSTSSSSAYGSASHEWSGAPNRVRP